MAREYGTRNTSRQKSNGPHQLLIITVTFLLGYFTATVFDAETLSRWINTEVLGSHESKPVASKAKTEPQKAQIPPKPKFEFYTLLANENGATQPNANHRVAAAPTTKAHQNATTAGTAAVVTAVAHTTNAKAPVTVKVAEAKPVRTVSVSSKPYAVQVASFKTRSDAEHMKATLILKGFNVNVVPVVHAQGSWFRVVVGPYPNRDLAQKAQMLLAKTERLRGMVTAA